MNTRHVRIDAYLHPVEPPLPPTVEVFESLLSEGFFDYMGTEELHSAVSTANRVKRLEEARYNIILNRVLLSYGLYVTNVAFDLPQSALAYGEGYSMSEALEEALAMRAWFIPAVISLYSHDKGLGSSLSALLPADPPASRALAV